MQDKNWIIIKKKCLHADEKTKCSTFNSVFILRTMSCWVWLPTFSLENVCGVSRDTHLFKYAWALSPQHPCNTASIYYWRAPRSVRARAAVLFIVWRKAVFGALHLRYVSSWKHRRQLVSSLTVCVVLTAALFLTNSFLLGFNEETWSFSCFRRCL